MMIHDKPDLGVGYTDREFLLLKARLNKLYQEAEADIEAKMVAFTNKFNKQDKEWQRRLANGDVDISEYRKWLTGQVFQGKQWQAKRQSIANALLNINEVATSMINDAIPDVFQFNANYIAYQIEHNAGVNFGFNLYNSATIKELVENDIDILPYKKLNRAKDFAWNMQNLKRELAKAIIEGEGIKQIAKRVSATVPVSNNRLAVTHARTAMTSAQNQGRLTRFKEAENMGIHVKKQWLATLDGRTRDSHRELDGQIRDLDEPFEVDGQEIRFPADPWAHPRLTYNCRCAMNSYIAEYPPQYTTRRDQTTGDLISNMTYKQWARGRK